MVDENPVPAGASVTATNQGQPDSGGVAALPQMAFDAIDVARDSFNSVMDQVTGRPGGAPKEAKPPEIKQAPPDSSSPQVRLKVAANEMVDKSEAKPTGIIVGLLVLLVIVVTVVGLINEYAKRQNAG